MAAERIPSWQEAPVHTDAISDCLLPSLWSPDVLGNLGQIVSELMPALIEHTDSCLGEFRSVQRKMRKRYNLVVTTVVQADSGYVRKFCDKVLRQVHLGIVPAVICTKVWCGKQKEPGDRLVDLLLAEVLQQNRTAHRVCHQNHLIL